MKEYDKNITFDEYIELRKRGVKRIVGVADAHTLDCMRRVQREDTSWYYILVDNEDGIGELAQRIMTFEDVASAITEYPDMEVELRKAVSVMESSGKPFSIHHSFCEWGGLGIEPPKDFKPISIVFH
ncbi:MAG: hypothetical protein LIP02_02795 [Bacteroidales bacterium]|nr:hypothetical protein [Bacteroidales bacterium]